MKNLLIAREMANNAETDTLTMLGLIKNSLKSLDGLRQKIQSCLISSANSGLNGLGLAVKCQANLKIVSKIDFMGL